MRKDRSEILADASIASALDDLLMAAGARASAQDYREAFDRLRGLIVDARTKAAGQTLREAIFRFAQHAPAGIALRRALLGDGGMSLEQEAALIGATKQAVSKMDKKLRRMFRLPPPSSILVDGLGQ